MKRYTTLITNDSFTKIVNYLLLLTHFEPLTKNNDNYHKQSFKNFNLDKYSLFIKTNILYKGHFQF